MQQVSRDYNWGVCWTIFNPKDAQSCNTQGSVRLVWGAGDWEGNVQICNGGVWGWVCHNTWDNTDAQIVCNELGFASTGN